MTERMFDIVIVGGGPAGLTLALAFSRALRGIRIALVDRRPFSVPRDQRAWALAAGVRRVFEQLGVWEAMAPASEAVRQMRITDSGSGDLARPLFLAFEGEVAPGEAFAHLVPNRATLEALMAALVPAEADGAAAPDVTLIAPAEVVGYSADARLGRVQLADKTVIAAPLVVASDGAQSAMRGFAGIETIGYPYGQSGIVTTIAHELPHDGTAYEHFRPAGPFASLPLPGNRSSLVWTERPETAERVKAQPAEVTATEIEAVMGSSLGAVTLEEGIQAFPLRLQLARSFVGPRLALIGDAAHVVHPIAGQGLNLGLKDVAALAEVAVEAFRLGLDPGAVDVLARYERWRRFDTALMAVVTDGMNRLFSNDVALVRAARDFGLGVVDRLGPLKQMMIARAAGVEQSGPRLLRGLPI